LNADLVELIGLAAATLTTTAFIPQVLKIWRTKSAEDLSVSTFTLFFFGVALWLAYGLLTGSRPVILANGITLVLAFAVLALAYRFRNESGGESGS
jgi:MtN3 and saliva related transmembrane protein